MNKIIKEHGFVRYALEQGGEIAPLEIDFKKYNETEDIVTSMNPSIWIDSDGTAWINIRCINYNLYNLRYREFCQSDQPIAYVSHGAYYLKTVNYFGNIDLDTFKMYNISKVKMLPSNPVWGFIGLEDARIIHWDDKMYLCGVRRDTKEDGEGRMELTQIVNNDGIWEEIERIRIPATGDDTAYLEKNWMPIIDKPYYWVKWNCPVEIAHFDVLTRRLDVRFTSQTDNCYRGDSHVIHIGKYYYCFVHLALNKQLREETNARVSAYNHYVLKYDESFNLIARTEGFSYSNDFNIEFGCGIAQYGDYCYLTFAENDNASFILKFNVNLIEKLFEE